MTDTDLLTLAPDLEWMRHPPSTVQHGGSGDFEPFGDEWIERPAIERMDEMVRRRGEAIALDDGVTRISYNALKRAVDDFAARLDDVAPPDRPVVAIVHMTASYPIIMMAAVAIGRTLVFIDASYPPEAQKAVIAAISPGAILLTADRKADDSIAPAGIPRLVLDLAATGNRTRPPYRPAELMRIGFTSGTTGRPKGLAINEAAAISSLAGWINRLHVTEADTVLSIGSPSVIGWGDALLAILTGARFRIVDIKALGLPEAFRQMKEDRVTILNFVPSALRNFFRVPGVRDAFHAMRLLNLFGESTLRSDLELFRANLPATCTISVLLASTEALGVFQWFVDEAKVDGAVVPVGYVMPYKEVALVGEDGRNVPVGEVGRIVVRSRFMAAGSWVDGRLEPPPSYPDPERPGWRIFQSGDFARLRPDGLAEFAGRNDQQVKIRGLRADLGIVEAAMRGQAGIADAATVLLSPEAKLIGFVATLPQVPAAVVQGARASLAKVLPDYMVPSQIHVLDAIPRLPNHKPDLKRLAELARATPAE